MRYFFQSVCYFLEDGKQKICGDVDFENVLNVVDRITPVPGGVGPMTVSMLMMNTVESAIRSIEAQSKKTGEANEQTVNEQSSNSIENSLKPT